MSKEFTAKNFYLNVMVKMKKKKKKIRHAAEPWIGSEYKSKYSYTF